MSVFPRLSVFLIWVISAGKLWALDSVVTINEIMYHPADDTGEWVELHNQMAVDVDMSGWRLSSAVDFVFPESTVIPAGGYLVVAAMPGTPPGSIGPFSGRLANDTETLRLRNNSDRIMDEVTYGDDGQWPVAPDGSGAALAKRPSGLEGGDPANWSFRTVAGGTPGVRNFRDPADPGTPATFEDVDLIAHGSTWRFNESGTDLGASWSQSNHPAGGDWQQGAGLFGFEPGGGGVVLPPALVAYWSFNNGENPAHTGTAAAVIQRGSGSAGQNGVFLNSAARTAGIVGAGAARFNNSGADGVNVGTGFIFTTGLTIEMVAVPEWNGSGYDEFFRKEDGGNRLLFSFQSDANNPGANPPVAAGPVLSFGLNTGGYKELDMPLDGVDGRPTLAELTNGQPHHFAATYHAATGVKAIWIDGTRRFSVLQAAGTNIVSGGGALAVIGNVSTGGGEAFTGVIDEVALYNVALGSAEIAAHAANALGGGHYFGALPAPIITPLTDPLTNAPYVRTTYFETDFTLSPGDLANLQALRLRHIVDDGAVFFLNGVEIARFNMPAGGITASIFAGGDLGKATRIGPIIVPAGALVSGANRLSVEVHQSGGTSDDIAFDAALEATIQRTPAIPPGGDPVPPGDGLVFSEISASGDANFRVELVNNGSVAHNFAGFEIVNSSATAGGSFVLPSTVLSPGGFTVFDQATLGFGGAVQDRLFLYAPSRSDVLDAVEVKIRPRARKPGALRADRYFTPAAPTFGSGNVFTFEDAIVINEIMYHHAPQYSTPGDPEIVEMETLLPMGAPWRFNEAGTDLGGAWQNAAHPVGGPWRSGVGPLGFAVGFGGGGAPDTPLIQTLHYSDRFTITSQGGIAGRPGAGAFPVGAPGTNVENNHGNPPRLWSNSRWSIAEDANVNDPAAVFTGSGAGSASGMTQTGGGVDYGIEYGLSGHFVVAFDAVQPPDRIDITASAARDTIGGGLAVFFRTSGHALPEIGLYNGTSEIESGLTSGLAAINQWHHYAVRFDTVNGQIEVFVDRVSRGVVDLTVLGGGSHNTASNIAVSVGGSPTSGSRFWSDNFQVGTPASGSFGTPLTNPALNAPYVVTYYFESDFTLTAQQLAQVSGLELTPFLDDGAVFYLNGTEVARVRMPAGGVNAATFASSDVGTPVIEGPLVLPASALVAGTNRLSVEVHQSNQNSADVVFGAQLSGVKVLSPGSAGTPFVENAEEWIELHNRSAAAVNVGGWELDGAVTFGFAPGTLIDPGEYVLVARDATAMGAKYPGVRILGGFSGKLANGGDFIRLEDAATNPADEVRYYDGGRWPAFADAGGSSLELRDPAANNAVAEAWAASDESAQAGWQTITYRGPGRAPVASNDPSGFNELVMGLLDSGECLLDDVSVIEDPDGVARQLIQNGGFDADTLGARPASWRVVGNHGDHGRTMVVPDPDNGSNKVLHVVATGPQWHLHDHLETTLKNGASFVTLDANKEYEISFRARWITGSPQVNSRLYFNRLARTHILARPTTSGTPGAPNSALVGNIGPTFRHFSHFPITPAPGQSVTVTVAANDPDGVSSVALFWSENGGAFSSMPMSLSADGLYEAILAGMSASTLVQFYVEGMDGAAAVASYPAAGPASRALFRVGGGVTPNPDLHNLSILTTAADSAFLATAIYVMSSDEVGATVVYDNEVFYDVGVTNKGSQRGRTDANRRGYALSFDPAQKFRGTHKSVGLDRSGGWRFGRTFGQDEILVHHILSSAGGIPSLNNDLVQLNAPNIATGPAQLQLARYTSDFLGGQYANGGDGSLHNYELIYHPTTTTGGPEGRKLPLPDAVNGVPVRTQGQGDREAYRYYFQLRSNRDRDDFSGMIGLTDLFGLNGAAFRQAAPGVIDIDQWLRAYAAVSLCGVSDSYFNNSNAHNARFYQRPEDGRMLLFPWDLDFAFINAATSPLVANTDLSKLISDPGFKRLFYQHVHDLIATTYNTGYMGPWVSHYSSKLPGQGLEAISGYIGSRAASALSQCESAIPAVGFAVTTNGGANFSSALTPIVLEGRGWVNVREIRLAGSNFALPVTWINDNAWRVTVPLGGGVNTLVLHAYDLQGNLVGTDTIDITNTGTVAAPLSGELFVSELMYHPAPPTVAERAAGFNSASDFEFIELLNVSGHSLDLAGLRFVDGVSLALTPEGPLGPGERLVIPENRAAFNLRYPNTMIHFGGEVLGGGNLSNSGERLALATAFGALVVDFTYGVAAPWPVSAAGNGYSLVLIAPDRPGGVDASNPRNWRSSRDLGGRPGSEDRLRFVDWATVNNATADPHLDQDSDQRGNYLEYLNGTLPRSPDVSSLVGSFVEDPARPGQFHLSFSFINALGADDAFLGIELGSDLGGWSEATVEYLGTVNNGDGTRVLSFRSTVPVSGVSGLFGRMRAVSWE